CLEKDPAARYPSARALADDLSRFLAHESIEARRPNVLERGRKWTRRHRALTLALGGVAAALLLAAL
ncbi:MAG TPA: hypothetical protein DEA08_00515, partial [Planctomycetes bacterium]|nr:hypothetical protein [Planctomycetota bacterium]